MGTRLCTVSKSGNRTRTRVTRFGNTVGKPVPVAIPSQNDATDPEAAFDDHKRVNQPPLNGHLFAYQWKNSHRPLTKSRFLTRLAQAVKAAGLDPLQGHGIRIGATLEYLLCGMPFDVMKVHYGGNIG